MYKDVRRTFLMPVKCVKLSIPFKQYLPEENSFPFLPEICWKFCFPAEYPGECFRRKRSRMSNPFLCMIHG